ncbi:AP2-associated kinase [Angomonas deanei]|nr:AP2-associated kinase [Angomonas deanei]|eukprot:EPY42072.1 AP2-associated kinase [Angomonas deanei]
MGTYCSVCPEPVNSLLRSFGINSFGTGVGTVSIDGVDYSTIRLIGEGGSAFVYEGVNTQNGAKVALKRCVFTEEEQRKRALEEFEIYKSVSPAPYIVTFYSFTTVRRDRAPLPEIWSVMELCSGPSLQEFIGNRIQSAQRFTVGEIYEIVDQAVGAVCYLHSRSPPVAHWDIKPDNFLFAADGSLKLCDFSSASRKFYNPKTSSEIAVTESELESLMTLLYRAPETLDLWSKKKIGCKVDVWSLGVLIYVLVFLEMPFEASAADIVDAVPKKYKEDAEPGIDEGAKPLMDIVMKMMLVKNPEERADIFAVSNSLSKIMTISHSYSSSGSQEPQKPRFFN